MESLILCRLFSLSTLVILNENLNGVFFHRHGVYDSDLKSVVYLILFRGCDRHNRVASYVRQTVQRAPYEMGNGRHRAPQW